MLKCFVFLIHLNIDYPVVHKGSQIQKNHSQQIFGSIALSIRPAIKAGVKFWCEESSIAVQIIFLPTSRQIYALIKQLQSLGGRKDFVDNLTQCHYFREWETKTFLGQNLIFCKAWLLC